MRDRETSVTLSMLPAVSRRSVSICGGYLSHLLRIPPLDALWGSSWELKARR